ncbi:MAG: hypothetical protein ACKVY0_08215 [Prosthecobacter sp.]|uniref:ribonuclease toxin HepT-like protein n=1 Tax=Prosthecobacter sp. TaxID=1965333 RepID=UPI00390449CD
MDRIGLITLQAEVMDDVRVASQAAAAARQRLSKGDDSGLESCAYQLVRVFNIIEQAGLRIAKAFENHIDDERGWHAEVVHRLSIEVPGVRPALYQPEILPALRDLRGFRHVITHAYDLVLEADRLAIVVRHAGEAARLLPGMVERFFEHVTAELAQS